MGSASSREDSLESHVKGLVLLKEIGKGSYGKVYKAVWNGMEVAAKRFHCAFFENRYQEEVNQYMQDFQREWEVLRRLNHPNVVKLHTVLLPNGYSPIIITELLHCDLEKYIRESTSSPKIPEINLIRIASDVIEGLQYMHGLKPPVVHRDLATKNILLTVHGDAKIADLGVAKVFAAGCDMYATQVPGTPVYAAPETYPVIKQFQVIDGAKYGPKVDVFSFGVVLLAMILGHEPKVCRLTPISKDDEMISEHERRKMDIAEMGEHCLKDLVLGCLQNDSKLRPDVKNIKEELEKHKWRVVQRSYPCEADEEVEFEKVGHQSSYDYKFKVVFIGDNGVGKSCLFNCFQNPAFNVLKTNSTIGAEIDTELLRYGSKIVLLEVIDTCSHEQFFPVKARCFHGVHGVFLVCDVMNRETFHRVPRWLQIWQQCCTESNALVILVGNKVDKVKKREISFEEGQEIARCHGLSYMETSAYNVESIKQLFKSMIQLLARFVDLGATKIELPDMS